jgi:hypothetical protein
MVRARFASQLGYLGNLLLAILLTAAAATGWSSSRTRSSVSSAAPLSWLLPWMRRPAEPRLLQRLRPSFPRPRERQPGNSQGRGHACCTGQANTGREAVWNMRPSSTTCCCGSSRAPGNGRAAFGHIEPAVYSNSGARRAGILGMLAPRWQGHDQRAVSWPIRRSARLAQWL